MESIISEYKTLWTILGAFAGGSLSFFIGLLMERYKNRRLEIEYNITYQKIGLPNESNMARDLQITYFGTRVESLYLFSLNIKNNSNFDAKELPINFYSDLNSVIYSYNIVQKSSTTDISSSANYDRLFSDYNQQVSPILAENPDAIIPEPLHTNGLWFYRNRQLIASAINRKENIEFNILIGTQLVNHQPYLYLEIPKAGVLLNYAKDPTEENERVAKISIVIGIIITLTLGTFLIFNNQDLKLVLIILSVIGALNFLLGIMVYKIGNFIYGYFQ